MQNLGIVHIVIINETDIYLRKSSLSSCYRYYWHCLQVIFHRSNNRVIRISRRYIRIYAVTIYIILRYINHVRISD